MNSLPKAFTQILEIIGYVSVLIKQLFYNENDWWMRGKI